MPTSLRCEIEMGYSQPPLPFDEHEGLARGLVEHADAALRHLAPPSMSRTRRLAAARPISHLRRRGT